MLSLNMLSLNMLSLNVFQFIQAKCIAVQAMRYAIGGDHATGGSMRLRFIPIEGRGDVQRKLLQLVGIGIALKRLRFPWYANDFTIIGISWT